MCFVGVGKETAKQQKHRMIKKLFLFEVQSNEKTLFEQEGKLLRFKKRKETAKTRMTKRVHFSVIDL